MSWIAISDLHLKPGDPARQEALVRFLEFIKPEAETIVINGDLFSFWFGYPDVIPYCYLPVLSKMVELADAGTRFKYFAGNHDFGLGHFFERFLPARIYPDSAEFEYLGARIHIEHGDLVDEDDLGYRLLRRIVRSRPAKALFQIVPPFLGLGVANGLAHLSRNYVLTKKPGFYYFCHAKAYDLMRSGVDLVVYGHGHRTLFSRMVTNGAEKLLVVIGGWQQGGIVFLRLCPGQSGLFRFDPDRANEEVLHSFDLASLSTGCRGEKNWR